MEVPQLSVWIVSPSSATENVNPVVGWVRIVVSPLPPNVIICVLPFVLNTLLEPLVLVGRMVWYQVQNNLLSKNEG